MHLETWLWKPACTDTKLQEESQEGVYYNRYLWWPLVCCGESGSPVHLELYWLGLGFLQGVIFLVRINTSFLWKKVVF